MRFEALREGLLKGGIAPRHVRRYLAELNDHLADLTAREIGAGYDGEDAAIRAHAALGEDAILTSAMLAQPKLRSLTARAPWLVFGLLPPLALLAGYLIPVFLLVLLAKAMGIFPGGGHGKLMMDPWMRQFLHAIALTLNLLVGPALAAGLMFAAWRQRLNPVWPLIGNGLILLLFIRFDVILRGPGHPSAMALTSFVASAVTGRPNHVLDFVPAWQAVAQFCLTLTPALFFLLQMRRRTLNTV
jgi:hypothetical protein